MLSRVDPIVGYHGRPVVGALGGRPGLCQPCTNMLLSALSMDISYLNLTGGLYLNNHVLAKAEELEVRVLLVGHGTQVEAEMFENLIACINPSNIAKVEMVAEMVRRHVDLTKVWGNFESTGPRTLPSSSLPRR
jgi:hypothetical protein